MRKVNAPAHRPVPARAVVRLGIVLSVVALCISPSAGAMEGVPSRAEYVEAAEPICRQGTEASERILSGVREQVKAGRLRPAGGQFIRAADAFEKTVERLTAIPRPLEDEGRLLHWLSLLEVVGENLRKVGVDLQKEQRVRANHDAIRAERSGNAANNAGFAFQFRDCRLRSSMFS